MSYDLGLNVVEVDGRVSPSIEPAPTSVAAFIIRAQRGISGEVVQVTNWRQFEEHFGGYIKNAFGAYAVRGFFDNGGAKAYITRVVNTSSAEATAASLTSQNTAPFNLERNGTVTVKTSRVEAETVVIKFEKAVAASLTLKSGAGPLNLAGKTLTLTINDDDQFITFEEGDMTAEAVAAMLNKEFTGIQVWVEGEGDEKKINIRTDQKGVDAADLTTPDETVEMLGNVDQIPGSGNIADITAVTADEAVTAFSADLPEELIVEKDSDGHVIIKESATGEDHLLEIVPNGGDDVSAAFNFQEKAGKGQDNTGCAVAASEVFKDKDGNNALTIKAGYRGYREKEDCGAWGNALGIKIRKNSEAGEGSGTYDLIVRYKGKEVETWEGLNNGWPVENEPKTRNPEVINNPFSGSKYIHISNKSENNPVPTMDGEKEKFEPLRKGEDDNLEDGALNTALKNALTLFDVYEVQLVCCPESADESVVTAALNYCYRRGDCMFIGHTSQNLDWKAAKDYGKKHQGEKVYGALYFPWIQVTDQLDPAKRIWIPPTGHIMGVYARTERERGIWKAPAGNAAQVRGALNLKHHITNADHTVLVKNGSVNAVRFKPGKGIVIDSSRTLSTKTIWYYVNVRLLFNFVKTSLMGSLTWVVQEPNDPILWNKVKFGSVIPFLNGLWRRGAFGPGAPNEVFTVKIDKENNTSTDIEQGRLNIEVYFYPSRPAETIVITVGQQEGGASASEG